VFSSRGTVRYEERGQGYREIWRARSRVPRDMKSEVKGTVRYEERGQGYRDVEKVGKLCCKRSAKFLTWRILGAHSYHFAWRVAIWWQFPRRSKIRSIILHPRLDLPTYLFHIIRSYGSEGDVMMIMIKPHMLQTVSVCLSVCGSDIIHQLILMSFHNAAFPN
jgi:hypothetical protein